MGNAGRVPRTKEVTCLVKTLTLLLTWWHGADLSFPLIFRLAPSSVSGIETVATGRRRHRHYHRRARLWKEKKYHGEPVGVCRSMYFA
jgi:hypothetical protein